jgi:hypothetical protein
MTPIASTGVVAERPSTDQSCADNPLVLVRMAIENGADPDKMEKLLDLARNWKAGQAAEAFAIALNAAQSAMPCVVKDKANSHTNSKYASLETVQTVMRPVYTLNGFSLSYGTEDSKLEGHLRVICDLSHVGGCTRRYHLDCPIDGAGMRGSSNKTGVQAMGSTISYARRYLMLMIFNVTVADQDIDGRASDALDTITEEDCLQIEELILDKKVDVKRFLQWCADGRFFVGSNPEWLVKNIAKKHLAQVLDTLNRKAAPK